MSILVKYTGTPFCQTHTGCPIHNLIPEWNELVYKGQWKEAIDRCVFVFCFPPHQTIMGQVKSSMLFFLYVSSDHHRIHTHTSKTATGYTRPTTSPSSPASSARPPARAGAFCAYIRLMMMACHA